MRSGSGKSNTLDVGDPNRQTFCNIKYCMKSVDFKRKEGKHFDALASCQCSGSSPAVLSNKPRLLNWFWIVNKALYCASFSEGRCVLVKNVQLRSGHSASHNRLHGTPADASFSGKMSCPRFEHGPDRRNDLFGKLHWGELQGKL